MKKKKNSPDFESFGKQLYRAKRTREVDTKAANISKIALGIEITKLTTLKP